MLSKIFGLVRGVWNSAPVQGIVFYDAYKKPEDYDANYDKPPKTTSPEDQLMVQAVGFLKQEFKHYNDRLRAADPIVGGVTRPSAKIPPDVSEDVIKTILWNMDIKALTYRESVEDLFVMEMKALVLGDDLVVSDKKSGIYHEGWGGFSKFVRECKKICDNNKVELGHGSLPSYLLEPEASEGQQVENNVENGALVAE